MDEKGKKFFKKDIFVKLAQELYHRYYLKQDFGSSLGLKKYEGLDTNPLRSFLGYTTLQWEAKSSIKVKDFRTALELSAFHCSIEEFVENLLGKKLQTKTAKQFAEKTAFERFQKELDMIDELFCQTLSQRQLIEWHQKDTQDKTFFNMVSKALKNPPQELTRLPVYSYKLTGDPHYFDEKNPAGILLLQMLDKLYKKGDKEQNYAYVEEKNELLASFSLLRDDIMNFVALRGLVAQKGNEVSQMWLQACMEGCAWNVPLKELLLVNKIYPLSADKVLVVENSGVYSILLEIFPSLPIVCSNGNFRQSVWTLLRKLVESDCQLYYVGDFDPEGLNMAQSIMEMFPDNAHLFCMDLSIYQEFSGIIIEEKGRLAKLKQIKHPELTPIAQKLQETGMVVYQEGFIDVLVNRISMFFMIAQ